MSKTLNRYTPDTAVAKPSSPGPIDVSNGSISIGSGPRIAIPDLLSTVWTAVLFADVLRGVHEILRPGFVAELATDGTNYGRVVTDATLLVSGIVLVFVTSVVVLSRVLPRRPNRVVNVVAAVMMVGGVLAIWPKDPDDYVFGAFQVLGSVLVVAISARWRDGNDSLQGS